MVWRLFIKTQYEGETQFGYTRDEALAVAWSELPNDFDSSFEAELVEPSDREAIFEELDGWGRSRTKAALTKALS